MYNSIEDSFFDLLRISLGTQQELNESTSNLEWDELYKLALKQSLAGVLSLGLEKIFSKNDLISPRILLEWVGMRLHIERQNQLQNIRARELHEIFKAGGFRTCILKGQGTATYYDEPQLRQCGDIDLWVDGERVEIMEFVQSKGVQIESVDIKDSTMCFFNDVMVEVHFVPNCMYSPVKDKRLKSFFRELAPCQFSSYDEQLGFVHTTIDFDLVYSLVHIYRHFFSEGIGLRHLVDYYYVLIHSNHRQREKAYKIICSLGMKSFAGGIMYILQKLFGLDSEYVLCKDNMRHGLFLLNEIMIGGNFGHYDNRFKLAAKQDKFKRGLGMFKKNLRFLGYYPSEVLWSPVWKLWHWCWRKQKGYL